MPVFPNPVRRIALSCLLLTLSAGPVLAGADPLREDVLGATMAGEFALQAGRLDEAAAWYLDAARAAGDDEAGLAERATRIALLGNDDALAARALSLWSARAPGSLAMRAAEATLALRQGRERAALRRLRTLIADPDPAGWRHALSVIATGPRDPETSGRIMRRLLDAGAVPDDLQAWLAFGDLAQRLEQGELARQVVEQIVARFPGEPRIALLRASLLRESGDLDGARAALEEVGDAGRIVPELRLAMAAEYDALGDFAAAEQVLARGPQDRRSYALRASLLARADDKETLAALYDELRRDAADPEPQQRLLLGQVAEFLDRHAEALEWYGSVPGGEPRLQARLRAANVLHELDRREEAFAALQRLQVDGSIDEEARRAAYLLEGELRAKDKDFDAENDAYARGLADWPDEPSLLYARALMWERRDDIARAEADLRRILVAEPENVAALNALGYTLADRTERYGEALELIDRARVAEPGNAAIIDSYGWVLYRLGRLDEALVELRRAYTLQKDAEIAAHIAEVLWMLGRRDEARRYFDDARRLDPENRSLQRALEKTGA
ncbi:tetratricopeptide repeat protein [Luteimonas composti]|uniref:Tetratricopeptide repeat protein n=1 Tax=Luteimonas composti TaxID=398257 RepID=A0ABT6MTC4_9GAMM|nr:tetratricopeptide repeat protein [Luteimonas composti]MDH7453695.1 tetratricopeptide repeat protein [Luteimonas composti]